jgi:anhydro-N-acetylmuramic acid kinase
MDDPYFKRPAPKSTGRETFQLQWLRKQLRGGEAVADVQATLLALTARTVADALRRECPQATRVIACGGGVHNARLMAALRDVLAPITVETTAAHGIDPDYVEAIAFAWLARETLDGRPGNRPAHADRACSARSGLPEPHGSFSIAAIAARSASVSF